MKRPFGMGLWLRNPVDMFVEFYDDSGTLIARYNKDTPEELNPVQDVSASLDCLGGLLKAQVKLNRRLFDPPFSIEVRVSVVDEIFGEVALLIGYQDTIGLSADNFESVIDLKPVDDLELKNLYQGSLPLSIPGITTELLGLYDYRPYVNIEADKVYTNEQIFQMASEKEPQLVLGHDGEGRSFIGLPTHGNPIIIDTLDTINLAPNNHVINDYATMVIKHGERGWRQYDRHRNVGRLTPRIMKDLGPPKTKTVTVNVGGPSVLLSELQDIAYSYVSGGQPT